MTAVGAVFVLAVVFFFGSLSLFGPLMTFLRPTQPDGSKVLVICTDMMGPFRAQLSFAAAATLAGAAIGLGAMIWLRFARRGPYFRTMAVLLGVVVVSGLLAVVCYRYYLVASFEVGYRMAELRDIRGFFNISEVSKAASRIPLIAGASALLVSAIMRTVRDRAEKQSQSLRSGDVQVTCDTNDGTLPPDATDR